MTLFKTEMCPKCKILQAKLEDKGLEYEKSNDVQQLVDLGFKTVPVLEVDGEYMDFGKAIGYLNNLK